MAWARAAGVGACSDEVFDEEANELQLAHREWKSVMEQRVKEGYRDGVDAGKGVSLQQGLNQGYKEGAHLIVRSGKLRGILSALLSWCRLQEADCALLARISDLLDAVGRYEERVLRHLSSAPLQPQPAELLDAIQDMGLQCDAQPGQCGGSEDGAFGERVPDAVTACYKSNSEAEAAPSRLECCRMAEKCTEAVEQNFSWLVHQTVGLMEQLSLSADLLQQVKQLEN
ncbi:protein YAE1 homolog [Rhinatrema bivittatum]|uniref:protein YAE1 homolog n=1 Tax=Rhinatrema bivittatum TaxID=194408 RepID=UPI00112A5DD6|nr:protein YAE1 homolog [Rhinatrema bivittatum]